MAKYMITRASIINRCNLDGKPHLLFTETERPCKEAFLEEIKDNDGNICSRYFIEIEDSVESLVALGTKYDVDVIVTRNIDFNNHIALVLQDTNIVPHAHC